MLLQADSKRSGTSEELSALLQMRVLYDAPFELDYFVLQFS
jgi:hypothetical protein